jgi:glucosyl-dolichyl phosphate glucuronosyltransferase
MHLEVVLPSYNRSGLLRLTLDSLLRAPIPEGLEATVLVVDNNSTDDTASIVSAAEPAFGGRLRRMVEKRQGKVYCLNTGIASSSADLIGLIDDDEQVDANWFNCIHSAFQDPAVDFIGGRSLPPPGMQFPVWFPPDFLIVIGWADAGDSVRQFGSPDFNAMLIGGNAVIRRAVLERVGPYSLKTNRTHERLISGEDEEMYQRLMASGCLGFYRPDLIVYHHIFRERLRKSYFRRWAFWEGVSSAARDTASGRPYPYLFGIPRWMYREALMGMASSFTERLGGSPSAAFSGELKFIRFIGRLYGRTTARQA